MVCAKCEKKLAGKSGGAPPDPFRNRNAQGTLVSSGVGGRKTNAIGGPSRASTGTLSASPSSSSGVGKAPSSNKLISSKGRYAPTSTKCKTCGTNASQGFMYCQGCSYKRGVCAMCGKMIMDTSKHKMSSV
ncbi:Microtubule-associated protein CRIPT [Ceraceosorus bombacis]|uniref:Cysteine-rich PDZ-binding protein n=1 Tax=Ceraceosorus bombacis TaxID=401625 RepID=A0A0P1BMC5_9BASI|nr:Microtubule-associated protein CRIPT [Ceraceosorus bombacis]